MFFEQKKSNMLLLWFVIQTCKLWLRSYSNVFEICSDMRIIGEINHSCTLAHQQVLCVLRVFAVNPLFVSVLSDACGRQGWLWACLWADVLAASPTRYHCSILHCDHRHNPSTQQKEPSCSRTCQSHSQARPFGWWLTPASSLTSARQHWGAGALHNYADMCLCQSSRQRRR